MARVDADTTREEIRSNPSAIRTFLGWIGLIPTDNLQRPPLPSEIILASSQYKSTRSLKKNDRLIEFFKTWNRDQGASELKCRVFDLKNKDVAICDIPKEKIFLVSSSWWLWLIGNDRTPIVNLSVVDHTAVMQEIHNGTNRARAESDSKTNKITAILIEHV